MRVLRIDQKIRQQTDCLAVGERDRPQLAMPDLQATKLRKLNSDKITQTNDGLMARR